MKKCLHGEIRDPCNLIRECHLRGVTNPQQITMDEFGTNTISRVVSKMVTAVDLSFGSLDDTCLIPQTDWKSG
jgi:hypothetical protein